MKTGGGGSVLEQMKTANGLVKSKAEVETMGKYHQDLVRWSRNVDKRYAWVILAALWTMMTTCLGSYRIYGLVFAKVTADSNYSRQDASWPVSMILTVENLVGPFVSIIVYHISFRQSLLVAGFLLTFGNGLAYWSDSLLVDVILIGFVQGMGYAFIFMPFMEIINNYFLRYRNVALGIALCGGTVSVFWWSPLFHYILDNYHWRTAYLTMGLLCCVNIIMVPLMKPNPRPTPPNKNEKQKEDTMSLSNRMSCRALSYQNSMRRQSTIMISRRRANGNGLDRNNSIISLNPFAATVGLDRKISRVVSSDQNKTIAAGGQSDVEQAQKQTPTKEQISEQSQYETLSLSEVVEEDGSHFEMGIIWSIIKTPGFHLIWYLESIYFWVFSIYCLVLVDYGADRGCTKDEAEHLLSFQSIGEMIGRLGLSILVDMQFLSLRSTAVIVLFLLSALLIANTMVTGFLWLSIITVGVSSTASLLYILLNGLLVQFLGERHVTIGYGMASFIVGVLVIFRPQAVGYFRDTLGSYDQLMMCLGGSCALGAVLCMIEPLIARFCCRKQTNDEL